MKTYVALVLLGVLGILGRVQAFPANNDVEDSEEGESTVWPIPQRDGSILWMTEAEAEASARAESFEEPSNLLTKKSDKVRFFLYTQKNKRKSIEIHMNDLDSLKNSTFNPEDPTRFLIHGWATEHNHEDLFAVKKALLQNGEKKQFNFISVDWSIWSHTNYFSAKKRCSSAGEKVAEFIDWLHNSTGMSFENLAVYGHSLGAHVAGFTGKKVKAGKIHTIVGLDPAMPLFRFKHADSRLASTDAEYVETIQTNGGLLGFYHPIGKSAFYPNGGRLQPGCGKDMQGSCSHGRSTAYFAEALRLGDKNGLTAIKCKDFEKLKDEKCNPLVGKRRLGDPNNANLPSGIFYLRTNANSPYGLKVKS